MGNNNLKPLHRRLCRIYALLLCLFIATAPLLAQNITLTIERASIKTILREIQTQTTYKFVYNDALVEMEKITSLSVKASPLENVLQQLLKNNGIAYEIKENQIILFPERQAPASQTTSQQARISVRGTVVDSNGEAIPGAYVYVKGNKDIGANTDANGAFTLNNINAGAVLTVSFIGFKTAEVAVGGRTQVHIVLTEDAFALEAAVATGYQTLAREKVTGAVATVNASALQERHTINLMQNMEGRVAGLVIQGDNITIRGAGSLSAITTPLLVIDGMPTEGRMEDLNPYDIESFTVLKDAAATAIYGARASNGVIVIGTKRARESGRTSVDVSANITVYQKRNVDYADNFYLTPAQQVDMEADYLKWWFSPESTATDPITTTQNSINRGSAITPINYAYFQLAQGLATQSEIDALLNQLRKNNYAQEYADNALLNRTLQQYNVAVRSMTEKFQSNLVLNFRTDNSGIIHARDNRFTIFYKGEYKMTDWVALEFSVNSVLQDATAGNFNTSTNSSNNPFAAPAYFRLLNNDGSFTSYNHNGYGNDYTPFNDNPALRPMHYNALQELAYNQTKTDRQSSRFHGGLRFNIMEGLTASTQFIYEADRNNEKSYAEAESYIMRLMRNAYTIQNVNATTGAISYTYMIPETGGKLASTNRKGDYWTARGQVDFNRTFLHKHSVNFLAGMEFRQTRNVGTRGILMGYDDQLQVSNTQINFQTLFDLNTTAYFYPGYPVRQYLYSEYISRFMSLITESFHRYASGYANLTYTYNGKYNAFGSFRRDYADVYGLDSKLRGTPLWSVGLSWNINEEDFMHAVTWVNYIKLRGSYGVTGNIYQGVTSRLTASTGTNRITGQPMSSVTTPANPFLTWEKTTTTNIGLDFSLLSNRLRGALDFYNRKGEDVFSRRNLESTYGFTSLAMNMASLYNRGVEVAVTYDWFRPKSRDQFSWSSSLTLAHNKNKVTSVHLQATSGGQLVWPAGSPGLGGQFKEDYPVSALWSVQFAGLNDQGVKTWWADAAKERKTNAQDIDLDAVVYSGQSDPKTTAGFENTLRYKGFSLNIMAVYYAGHVMRFPSVLTPLPVASPTPSGPMPSYLLRAWRPDNTDTDVPGSFQYRATGGTAWPDNYTDIYVVAADFFKIRNIIFGYDVPKPWLSKVGLHNATLRFQIDNPNISYIKNDVGLDPETRGVRTRTSYIFGVNFSF